MLQCSQVALLVKKTSDCVTLESYCCCFFVYKTHAFKYVYCEDWMQQTLLAVFNAHLFPHNTRAHVCQSTTYTHNLIEECHVFILAWQHHVNLYFI